MIMEVIKVLEVAMTFNFSNEIILLVILILILFIQFDFESWKVQNTLQLVTHNLLVQMYVKNVCKKNVKYSLTFFQVLTSTHIKFKL